MEAFDKVWKCLFLTFISGATLYLSLVAYFMIYTSARVPMVPGRRSGVRFPEVVAAPLSSGFFISLVLYTVLLLIGLACVRLLLGEYLGVRVAKAPVGRLKIVFIGLAAFVFGFLIPMYIAGSGR